MVQPLQANTGMDVRELKKKYGKDLTFWGNIDEMAMTGTFDDIEKEIAGKIPAAMKDGGYIYHSDHSIPPTVSLENYKHVMRMVAKHGKYLRNQDALAGISIFFLSAHLPQRK